MALSPRLLLSGFAVSLLAVFLNVWPSPAQSLGRVPGTARQAPGEARLSPSSRHSRPHRRPRSCKRVVLPSKNDERSQRRCPVRLKTSPILPAILARAHEARTTVSVAHRDTTHVPLYLVLLILLR
jgi:hypothetical protein